MYSVVENFVGLVSGFLYTYWLVFALILCGLYLSFRTGFIQLRFLKDAIFVLREKSQKEHISPFGALMVSTASRVGIGNIVGVAVAISGGGVGALFWMWITAILGGTSKVLTPSGEYKDLTIPAGTATNDRLVLKNCGITSGNKSGNLFCDIYVDTLTSLNKEQKELVEKFVNEPELYGVQREGVVIRLRNQFIGNDFSHYVCKWVRKDHVQTDDHWTKNWKKAKLMNYD